RESIECEILDPEFASGSNDDSCGFRARPMPLNPRQMPLFRPASVAIHDNGHVRRQGLLGLWTEVWLRTHGLELQVTMCRAQVKTKGGRAPSFQLVCQTGGDARPSFKA